METLEAPRHTDLNTLVQRPFEQRSTAVARAVVRIPWQDRIEKLAKLTPASLGTDSRGSDTGPLIHHHLDAIETILRDPRPDIVHEVTKCRSRRGSDRDNGLLGWLGDSETAVLNGLDDSCQHEAQNKEMALRLQTLLGEVTGLNKDLRRRHAESVEIRDLLETRCRGLARTVAELEEEVSEMQSDLADDAVELEGIQGTVRGLQDWAEGLREGQGVARVKRAREGRKVWRGWAGRTASSEVPEIDGDVILEGFSAWIRGWKDVEEEYKARARTRKLRRERRQDQLLKRSDKR